jgi:type IV pilus assembly protein PilP
MSKMNMLYKFSAGIFCGCLACALVSFGCGGKGKSDSPEKQKQKQEVVRKIPVAAPQPEAAATKEQKEQPRPVVEPAAAPEQVGQQQAPTPAESGPAVTPAPPPQETATPPGQPGTAPEVAVETPLSQEKQAEMEAVTREAGTIKKDVSKATVPVNEEEAAAKPVLEKQEEAPPEAVQGSGAQTPDQLTGTAQDALPVIDLGAKEAPGAEDNNLLGYEQEGEGPVDEEGESRDVFNPFTPLFQKEKTGVAFTTGQDGRQQRKFITELEKIDIGQLTLEGIIQAQTGNRAIVTDASGKGYVVKEGTYVGLNSGTVEKIESDRIVIAESIGTRQSKTVLKLQKPAGE